MAKNDSIFIDPEAADMLKNLSLDSQTKSLDIPEDTKKGLMPIISKHTHPEIVELLEQCWEQDPSWRPEFSKIITILMHLSTMVHHKFELQRETLFLTVIIDRFLAKQSVIRKSLQLVGLVALLLACKYEEVSVPVVNDLIFISDSLLQNSNS